MPMPDSAEVDIKVYRRYLNRQPLDTLIDMVAGRDGTEELGSGLKENELLYIQREVGKIEQLLENKEEEESGYKDRLWKKKKLMDAGYDQDYFKDMQMGSYYKRIMVDILTQRAYQLDKEFKFKDEQKEQQGKDPEVTYE